MTCKDVLRLIHPEKIGPGYFGGCDGCPHDYDLLCKPDYCAASPENCNKCWNREISEEQSKSDYPLDKIFKLIDDAMVKRDRTVHLYFNPETGLSINIIPWPDVDELYEAYSNGRITGNDFRKKMGLDPILKKPKTYKLVELPDTDD